MKNKFLLSWYATMNDFKWENINGKRQRLLQIEENGPTASVHTSHWDDYEKHTILYNEGDPKAKIPEEDYATSLRSFLQSQFPHHAIEMRKVPINDVISIEEIASKVQPVIAELSLDRHIDIFISPGTPSMQMAWILSGLNFKDKVTLFQGRAGRFTTDGKNEKVIINLESSIFPRQLNITEAIENKATKPENAGNVPKGLQEVYALAAKVAKTDRVTCLILGPNGSGKERLARYIHDQSARRNQPYIAVNCAAFSDELLRSELFGHKKGAFTGADKDRIGILEDANGGTVFLDEIGDISPVMQVALLRVLQEKEVQPVGENKPRKIDVRIIAATNRNLKEDCKSGRFRWDLYYRLHIAPLEISPLYVQGKQTIKEWIFLKTEEFAKDFGGKPLQISKDAMEKLKAYHWPGNIRELEHLILRLYTFRELPDSIITVEDLPSEMLTPDGTGMSLEEVERAHIVRVLNMTGNNILRASEILKISRNTIKNKMGETLSDIV